MDDTGPFDGPRRGRRRGTALCAVSLGAIALVAAAVLPARGQEPTPAELPLGLPPATEAPATLDQPLVDVKVVGNTTIPSHAVSQHIKVRPGRPISDRDISEDTQALYRTRWFITVDPKVSYTDEGPVLTFHVVERPIVKFVDYRGCKGIKKKHLVALTGIKPHSPYDPQTNIEAARRIEEHYREKGFAFAKVTLTKGGDAQDREVIFDIVEGSKVRVEDVNFHGNEKWALDGYASDGYLKTKLQTETMWWPLPFMGLYKPETIPNDIAALKQYYIGLGFFDVRIRHEMKLNDEKSRITLDYFITEGVRYKVVGIRYEGNAIYAEKELSEDRKLNPGDHFNERFLNKDLAKMQDMYGRLGRLYATVTPDTQYSETPGQTVLVYKINEDRPYYVRNVNANIRGDHPYTKRTLPLNVSRIHPGDLADPKKIKQTQARLKGVGYFDTAPGSEPTIDIRRVGFEDDDVDPLIRGQSDDEASPFDAPYESYREDNPFADPPGRSSYRDDNPFTDPNPFAEQPGSVAPAASAGQSRAVTPADGYVPSIDRPMRSGAASAPATTQVAAMAPQAMAPAPVQRSTAPRPVPTAQVSAPVAEEPVFTDPNRTPFEPTQRMDAVVNPYGDAGQIQQTAQNGDYAPPWIPTSPQGDPFSNYVNGQPPGYVDLDLNVTEARTGRLMIGAGVNSNSGVVGNIVLSEDNFDITRLPRSPRDIIDGTAFRGAGQRFRIEAVPGNVVSRYLVSLEDPFVFDTDYSLGGSAFYFQRFYPDWDEERAGGRITLGRQLTQNLSVKGITRIENVDISNPDVPTPDLLARVVGDNLLFTLGGAITHDTRDSPLNPSEGHIAELTYTHGIEDFQFPRVDLEATQFFTIFSRPDGSGKHILSLGGQLGYTGDDTPIFERYFAGGFQSLRGFEFRGVGPRQFGVNVGGQFLAVGSVQYMFPLLANDVLQGVVFSDFGTVEDKVEISDFRASVGAGLRVAIPAFGPVPLAFDFGFPVAKADGDETQIFSFYVGVNR